MSVMLSAASALRWVCALLGLPSEAALLERVATLTPVQRERAPLFLPYLGGERTPHNDPHAQGVLFGLSHEHDAVSIGYAVIEGVSFGLLDGWTALDADKGAVTVLSMVGGGARSALWSQLIASAIGVATRIHDGAHAGAALGAARLAWLADGGDEASVCAAPATTREFTPGAGEAALLSARAERFRALYPALRSHFSAIGATASS
jgi:xylulokinase